VSAPIIPIPLATSVTPPSVVATADPVPSPYIVPGFHGHSYLFGTTATWIIIAIFIAFVLVGIYLSARRSAL
jgi:hypothetical protein